MLLLSETFGVAVLAAFKVTVCYFHMFDFTMENCQLCQGWQNFSRWNKWAVNEPSPNARTEQSETC